MEVRRLVTEYGMLVSVQRQRVVSCLEFCSFVVLRYVEALIKLAVVWVRELTSERCGDIRGHLATPALAPYVTR